MSPVLFIIPIAFILIGSLCLIFPQPIGVRFCRLGKWIWKKGTFGLTDMKGFYQEKKAPYLFRLVGIGLLAGGLLSSTLLYFSFSGPGLLFAMREAGIYLKESYGDSGWHWNLSAFTDGFDATEVTVTYRYGRQSGVLKGKWDGQKYLFSEEEQGQTRHGSGSSLD